MLADVYLNEISQAFKNSTLKFQSAINIESLQSLEN